MLDSSPDAYSPPSSRPHHYLLYLVDPLDPAGAGQLDDLGNSSAPVPPQLIYGASFGADAATHAWSYNGMSTLMYVNGGKVWTVDLRVGTSHAPRQTSSTQDACSVSPYSSLLQVSADGRDMWVLVEPCSSSGKPMFVRSTMSDSDAPVPTLSDTVPLGGLDDGAKNNVGFLMKDGQGLAFYSTGMVRLGKVAGADGLGLPSAGVRDYVGGQVTYGRYGNNLQRMTWTSSTATLEPPIYSFAPGTATSLSAGWIGDADAMFIFDGLKVLRLTSGGIPQLLATLSGTAISQLALTDDRVVIQQSDRSSGQVLAISTIAKNGGPVTTIASANGVLLGTTADGLVYSQGGVTHLARADGSGDQVIAGGAMVYQRQRVADRWTLSALAACVPDAGTGKACSNGSFRETTLATQSAIDIGHLTHANTYASNVIGGAGYGVVLTTAGVPEWLTYYSLQNVAGQTVNTRDLYAWTPGTAGSLARITANIP